MVYFGNRLLGDIRVGKVDKSFIYTDLEIPSINIDSSSGLITASVYQTTSGYVYSSSTTNTYSLPTISAVTITPNDTTQTLAVAGDYAIGTLAVAPVPTEVQTVTAVGSYYATTGTYISSFNVDIPIYTGAIIEEGSNA